MTMKYLFLTDLTHGGRKNSFSYRHCTEAGDDGRNYTFGLSPSAAIRITACDINMKPYTIIAGAAVAIAQQVYVTCRQLHRH